MVMPKVPGTGWQTAWSLGFNFAASVAGFFFVGYAIDRWYETSPWGVLIGTLLGLVGGMYNLIRQALAASKQAHREDVQANPGDGKQG